MIPLIVYALFSRAYKYRKHNCFSSTIHVYFVKCIFILCLMTFVDSRFLLSTVNFYSGQLLSTLYLKNPRFLDAL